MRGLGRTRGGSDLIHGGPNYTCGGLGPAYGGPDMLV
jgi:hypothetical protein